MVRIFANCAIIVAINVAVPA